MQGAAEGAKWNSLWCILECMYGPIVAPQTVEYELI